VDRLDDPAPIIRDRVRPCRCAGRDADCLRCGGRGWVMPLSWQDCAGAAAIAIMAVIAALGVLAL
jgi:hypothetical protein